LVLLPGGGEDWSSLTVRPAGVRDRYIIQDAIDHPSLAVHGGCDCWCHTDEDVAACAAFEWAARIGATDGGGGGQAGHMRRWHDMRLGERGTSAGACSCAEEEAGPPCGRMHGHERGWRGMRLAVRGGAKRGHGRSLHYLLNR
jgi:hypothetical protein